MLRSDGLPGSPSMMTLALRGPVPDGSLARSTLMTMSPVPEGPMTDGSVLNESQSGRKWLRAFNVNASDPMFETAILSSEDWLKTSFLRESRSGPIATG